MPIPRRIMEIDPQVLQFGGSLVAILVLAGLAWALKLGGKPVLKDEETAAKAAGEVVDGYLPARISISRDKTSALMRDEQGRIILIKRHGNKFAGRVLTPSAKVGEEVDAILVDPVEPRFGTVRLSLEDPAYWADAINRL